MAAVPTNAGAGSFTGMDAAQMLALLYNYGQANATKGATTDAAANASSVYTDAAGRTNSYMDLIASMLKGMNGNGGMTSSVLPSSNGGGAAYTSAAKYGDPTPALQAMLGTDRDNMLQQLMQANDLTTRQVNIGDYSVKNVKNMADQKYSSLAPSVDRAAAIASSQGFGSALKGGVADSTKADGMADELTRKFGDVYAKLRQQSDDSALADNAAMYQSYLSGKGQQVAQNQMLGTLANQLLGQTAQIAGNSANAYTNASNASADRLLRAVIGADSASVQNSSVNNNSYAQLLSALVNLNSQNVNTAQNRFNAASQASQVAGNNQGSQLANLAGVALQNPWVQNTLNNGFRYLTGGSSGSNTGSTNTLTSDPFWDQDPVNQMNSDPFWDQSPATLTSDPFWDLG